MRTCITHLHLHSIEGGDLTADAKRRMLRAIDALMRLTTVCEVIVARELNPHGLHARRPADGVRARTHGAHCTH
jgi:hypothetical protein